MNIESNQKPQRSTDNVHLEFLLGSVGRSPRRRSRAKRDSRSTPPSREGSLQVRAKERWIWATKEISRGYCLSLLMFSVTRMILIVYLFIAK